MAAERTATANPVVFLNGTFVPPSAARLPLDDAGVLYGVGFFETFRTCGRNPHHWRYHRNRLEAACERAQLALPSNFLACDESALARTVTSLLDANGYEGDAVFRYTVTAGSAQQPSEFLVARPLPVAAPAEGIALRVLALRRDSGEWIPRPKSLNYTNAWLGGRELVARKAPTADEGLFLARDEDVVVETARQNVAWISEGCIQFPDTTSGAVAGTCLAWLIDQRGKSTQPVRARLAEVLRAEAVFCLNAVRGVTPVNAIWDQADATQLASLASAAHPVVRDLQQSWENALRETAGNRFSSG